MWLNFEKDRQKMKTKMTKRTRVPTKGVAESVRRRRESPSEASTHKLHNRCALHGFAQTCLQKATTPARGPLTRPCNT